MFVKPSSAFVENPSLVASSSGSAKNALYARLFPSTRNSSESRAGASSSCSSAPVSVFGDISASLRRMARLEVVPFSDEHLEDAAALLAARHARHREAEPLLPELADPLAPVEQEWRTEGASGAFAPGRGYLIAAPITFRGITWMRAGMAGQAIEGDREAMRDLYAAAAQRWVDAGHRQHAVFLPAHDAELVDAWFRLSFGASAAMAIRETGTTAEHFEGGVEVRPGTLEDFADAARLELAVSEAMEPSPSFSDVTPQTYEEALAEWQEDGDSDAYELFVAEREGRVVGHILLYRRPPDLRVREDS